MMPCNSSLRPWIAAWNTPEESLDVGVIRVVHYFMDETAKGAVVHNRKNAE